MRVRVQLRDFANTEYNPGRGIVARSLWLLINRIIFQTSIPWPYELKVRVLRMFGSQVKSGVVIKPRVNIKYPWNVTIGNYCWIGEEVWIDSLGKVTLGDNVCLSQGCMIETGNHDWADPAFGLIIHEVVLEDGAWAGAQSLILPGGRLRSHAVLTGGSVLSGETEPYSIYIGNPAVKVRDRVINEKS